MFCSSFLFIVVQCLNCSARIRNFAFWAYFFGFISNPSHRVVQPFYPFNCFLIFFHYHPPRQSFECVCIQKFPSICFLVGAYNLVLQAPQTCDHSSAKKSYWNPLDIKILSVNCYSFLFLNYTIKVLFLFRYIVLIRKG